MSLVIASVIVIFCMCARVSVSTTLNNNNIAAYGIDHYIYVAGDELF